jgi:predicted SAM-dependent methyltransferase
MLSRNEKVLSYIDPANQLGVEIGPLDRPIVTRKMGKIRYIDHDTAEALRVKYSDPGTHVNLSNIVDVDYVWGEKTLVDLLQPEAPFDYFIASHVIEHVPDLIGWLSEIRAVLKLGGILSLVIPDKRQCFDYFRHHTITADVVEAFLRGNKKPSPRQIFEDISSSVTFRGNGAWNGFIDESELVRFHPIEKAWDIAKTSIETSDYFDVHCWVFTPLSFFTVLSELSALNLLRFEVAQFYETEGCEFFVSLRATDAPNPTSIANIIASITDGATTSTPVEIKETVLEMQSLQRQILAMESSKFWKMRTAWCKVKRKLGLLSR